VWDLTVEAKIYKDYVSIIGGVNNIFNRSYYARIRADGVDPAMPGNWYAGVKVSFLGQITLPESQRSFRNLQGAEAAAPP
jgi:hypothetical protein